MAEVGFISENSEAALYIDTGQKSFNQLMAEKVTKRDLVINFRKPRPDELPQPLTLSGDEDAATFTQKATAILREALELHPGSPADRLYDELVSRMVRQGSFERHNFDALLRRVAEPVDNRWYLLETADQPDAAESAKEETAAAHLTAFMTRALADDRPKAASTTPTCSSNTCPSRRNRAACCKPGCPNSSSARPTAAGGRPPTPKKRRKRRPYAAAAPCGASSASPTPCWRASPRPTGIGRKASAPPPIGCANAAGRGCTRRGGRCMKKAALIFTVGGNGRAGVGGGLSGVCAAELGKNGRG
jgi:hypothetical protein